MTMTMGDDDGDGHDDLLSNNIVILLIAMGSAAFFVSMYHVIAICLCNQRNQNPPQPPLPASASSSVVNLIPTHTYRKNKAYRVVQGQPNTINNDDHDTCVVCLGDFEEGEELRTMPECMHSFHMACIDTWLSSHWSCPICRSSATPSAELEVLHSEHDFNYQHRIDVTQIELEIQRLR